MQKKYKKLVLNQKSIYKACIAMVQKVQGFWLTVNVPRLGSSGADVPRLENSKKHLRMTDLLRVTLQLTPRCFQWIVKIT